jgi:G3E family GTPase
VAPLQKKCFEEFVGRLPENVYRAKGFVRFSEGSHLFNFVAGRWELEPFPEETTALVFIGKGIKSLEPGILGALKECEA